MYESFYGFREKPFSLLPDPEFLYLGSQHSAALAMLEYGFMNQVGITVITGEIGSGKTSLVRHLLNKHEFDVTLGLITNTHRSFGELMPWVSFAFGLEYRNKDKVELYEAFVNFVIQEYAKGRRTVLVIDEAQNMNADILEEARMLSNINADKDQVLQLILLGQPELRDRLRQPNLEQFAQRLEPLGAEETRGYIEHRLQVAGGDPSLFDGAACEIVYEHSRGVPRLINILCDTALVYAFAEQKPKIDTEILGEVIGDKAKGGIFPSESRDSDEADEHWPDDPQLANSLNNLANAYRTQGKFEEAESNYKRALNMLENSVGPGHVNVATVLNNLAVLYRKQGNYTEAEPLYGRALAIIEKSLGPEHRKVAMGLNNLAVLYRKQGKYREAEPLQRRGLAILEKTLVPDHPNVAASLKNLAKLHRFMGKNTEAAACEQRALAIASRNLSREAQPPTKTEAPQQKQAAENSQATVHNILRPLPSKTQDKH